MWTARQSGGVLPTDLCARCESMSDMSLSSQVALQLGGLLGGPLGQLLLAIVVIGVVVLVGRVVLQVAWRLVTIAALIIGVLFVASLFLG
jgi:hypothetical protein